jgi:hypothetical protein
MSNALSDMDIEEISLVGDGANPGAKIEIWKAKNMSTFDAKMAQQKLQDGFWRLTDALRESIKEAMEGEAPAGDVTSSIDSFVAALKALVPDATAISKALAGPQKEIEMTLEELAKSLEAAEAKLDELEKANGAAVARAAELEGFVKAKDTEIAGLKSDIAKAKPADTEDEILKALPEAARALVLKAKKAEADATAALAKAREAQDTAEAIAKAKTLNFGKPEDVGPLLMRVAKGMTTTDDAATLEQLLKSAGEVASKSPLFKAHGTPGNQGDDPEALLKQKASEIKKARPELSEAQAYDAALAAHPDLYSAYVAKRRAA